MPTSTCGGLVISLQLMPFQCSARAKPGESDPLPTAIASFEATAATARKEPVTPAGSDIGLMLHVEPFQCSISGVLLSSPTAHTSWAEMAVTAASLFSPGRPERGPRRLLFGLGTRLHTVPFQCSINVRSSM